MARHSNPMSLLKARMEIARLKEATHSLVKRSILASWVGHTFDVPKDTCVR
ncbi:MAG TPA: hypothetical protein VNK04_05820 [Gemmataceae bacterium]|nr:hypothetical protein [Gemmataceae bacterium]